jgi:hypothetical protein
MFEPLQLRDDRPPELIVVVRLGVITLADQRLAEACERTHARWSVWGFSVLEVPNGDDFAQLARLRPEVAERRQVLVANGRDLLADGFPLLPTLDYPHWTVQLPEATVDTFGRVRSHFAGPVANPAFRGP